jgi:hypothetical protein
LLPRAEIIKGVKGMEMMLWLRAPGRRYELCLAKVYLLHLVDSFEHWLNDDGFIFTSIFGSKLLEKETFAR